MVSIDVDYRGLDQFIAHERRARSTVTEMVDDVMREGADDIARATSGDYPRLTGALAGSVSVEEGQLGASITVDRVYAGWIEFGGAVGRNNSIVRPYSADGTNLLPKSRAYDFDDSPAINAWIKRSGL